MGRARKDSLVINFSMGVDAVGRDRIANLQISKFLVG